MAKDDRLIFHVGAALAVAALIPISELLPTNGEAEARLHALRQAAQGMCLELLCHENDAGYSGMNGRRLAQNFDRTPLETVPP